MKTKMALTLYSGLLVLSVWTGGLIPLARPWDKNYLRMALAFGAGVLLGATFLHIIPGSIQFLGESSSFYVLLGFLTVYLIERFTMIHACEDEEGCDFHTVGILSFIGFSLHNFVNGIALGSSLLLPALGAIVFFATVVHKIPESFSLVSILIRGEHPRPRILGMLFILSLMIPLGAGASFVALEWLNHRFVAGAVAFSGGTFLHIALADLFPEMHRASHQRLAILLSFLLGLCSMAAARWLGS